jgi:hypothetical protein
MSLSEAGTSVRARGAELPIVHLARAQVESQRNPGDAMKDQIDPEPEAAMANTEPVARHSEPAS